MKQVRRVIFWIHLTLAIMTGVIGALMAGTGVIMAFADSYLDIREYEIRRVVPSQASSPRSLVDITALITAEHPSRTIQRVGFDRNPHHAIEFYLDQDGLIYADPFSGELHPSDSVPLRRKLHKGVEQWHRFLGLTGDSRATGKWIASWMNVALIPLFLSGLVLWWPTHLRWPVIRAGLWPAGGARLRGTQRSWHVTLGFWTMPFLLIMVMTATTHSFAWVRKTATSMAGSTPAQADSHDSLWAPSLPNRSVPLGATPLTLDELRTIADRAIPNWTRLDLYPPPPVDADRQTKSASLVAQAPGWGPAFFPVVVQVDPVQGDVLDIHSWDDLSGGTRLLAWARWLHKGEAFGRTGQIVMGLACLIMLVLIYTGWTLAIRRLLRKRKPDQVPLEG